MPVPKSRELVVRRDGQQRGGFEAAVGSIDHLLGSAFTRRESPGSVNARDDHQEEEPDREHEEHPPFPVGRPTTTARPNNPTGTSAAQVTQFPPPRPSGGKGLSPATHHLLIAAGSIGATIILVMAVLAIHRMRKRNLTFRQALDHGRYRFNRATRRGGPRPPPKSEEWDTKRAYESDYGSIRKNSIPPPQRAMSMRRSESNSSQRLVTGLQSSESFSNRGQAPEPFQPSTFLLDSPPAARNPLNDTHRRNASETTASAAALPPQTQNPLQRTRNASSQHTRPTSSTSTLRYPDPPLPDRSLSPLPPPPTFKQFLNNRPTISNRNPGPPPAIPGPGMVSHFSWTNSNAPQTPHDTNRDTASGQIPVAGRDSLMTQRSSVPRFRTIDSWVNQQANRIEEQKLREQFRLTQSSSGTSAAEEAPAAGLGASESIPEVPEIPASQLRGGQIAAIPWVLNNKAASLPSSPVGTPVPASVTQRSSAAAVGMGRARHERQDTRTTVETAPIFRQHPGTEVRFSTRSAVPSEILGYGRVKDVLS
ncbi:uncharacterized protein EI97DRAFT_454357 [Westerdykella ornata]|uniref:Uncharacterized protein n=1 Tax=Westerdykella ornata TaxID=318751 RepID=A0A6A6JZ64_WESOR|nr:uncharacterized protein EI97DRAFT_454357 [Westerdykella ornata]KAF2281138.1 hypothetical protein EI97DRAFT_454357 [Westerdykella ornata]